MDIRSQNLHKARFPRNRYADILVWLEKKIVFRRHEYSVKYILLFALILFCISALLVYFLISSQQEKIDPNAAIQQEIKTLTGRIGKFMELPVGEEPTLATVTDRGKLKGQEFFSQAQNGDKLLVYPKARKAILFRPSSGKIIEVTNLTSGGENNSQAPTQNNINSEN